MEQVNTSNWEATANWNAVAQRLVKGFVLLNDPDDQIRVLDKFCERLGGSLYPAFLQVLYNIERHGDAAAKDVVTEVLVYALMTGRLPAGKLSAWGGSDLPTNSSFGQTRSLGPIEFLCAWYAQPTGMPPLTRGAFIDMSNSLLRLVSTSEKARAMYCSKLLSDAEDALSGSMSGKTRSGLTQLANCWQNVDDANEITNVFLDSLHGSSLLDQTRLNPFS